MNSIEFVNSFHSEFDCASNRASGYEPDRESEYGSDPEVGVELGCGSTCEFHYDSEFDL